MAFQPSKRKKRYVESEHANITPMMNLMVVLIPLLLTSAEFVKLGVIELNLPPASRDVEGDLTTNMPEEDQRKLDLTVTITDRGFFISSSVAVLSGENENEPSIPMLNGQYDFDALSLKLLDIKKRAKEYFPDADQIIIMAEPEVDYQTIVSTMDASRSIRVEGDQEILFPNVSLSAGVY